MWTLLTQSGVEEMIRKLTALSLLLLCTVLQSQAAPASYLSYDEFIHHLEDGNIKSVKLSHYSGITGTYLVDGEERGFQSFSKVGTAADPLLIQKLKEQNVSIEIVEQEKEISVWKNVLPGMLFIWGIPIVTLILVIAINRKINRLMKNIASKDSRFEGK